MPSSTQLTSNLIDVAMGRKPADLVLREGTWVCVQSGEFVPDTDIAIKDGPSRIGARYESLSISAIAK